MKEAHGIGDIVAHPSLTGNPNLILINRSICFRLLHPLVPIHLLHHQKKKKYSKKITSKPCIKQNIYTHTHKNITTENSPENFFFFFKNANRKKEEWFWERREKLGLGGLGFWIRVRMDLGNYLVLPSFVRKDKVLLHKNEKERESPLLRLRFFFYALIPSIPISPIYISHNIPKLP